MSTKDLHIFASESGGELALLKGDLVLSETLFQSVYISLFGGNVEASTLGNETQSEERFDYWANSLIFGDKENKQFNSLTEKILTNVTLNSVGRLKIEQAVKEDLEFLTEIAEISINVSILDDSKVLIQIGLKEVENQELSFIFDNAKQELIIDKVI